MTSTTQKENIYRKLLFLQADWSVCSKHWNQFLKGILGRELALLALNAVNSRIKPVYKDLNHAWYRGTAKFFLTLDNKMTASSSGRTSTERPTVFGGLQIFLRPIHGKQRPSRCLPFPKIKAGSFRELAEVHFKTSRVKLKMKRQLWKLRNLSFLTANSDIAEACHEFSLVHRTKLLFLFQFQRKNKTAEIVEDSCYKTSFKHTM